MDLKNKKIYSTLIVYSIVAVVLLLLFLIIPIEKGLASWIAMIFAILSIAVGFFVTIYAFGKGDKLVSKVYGFPIAKVGFIYTLIQVFFFVIIFILGAFIKVPAWIVFACSIVISAAAVIGIIITDNVRDHVEAVDTATYSQTNTMSTFRIDISDLVAQATDPEVKKALQKLEEELKYSDPVSSEATREIEEKILIEIRKKLVNNQQVSLKSIDIIYALVQRRNRMCKTVK